MLNNYLCWLSKKRTGGSMANKKAKATNVSGNLELLTMRKGKFYDKSGRPVKVTILGLGMGRAGFIYNPSGKPYFRGDQIPEKANAFVQGDKFDISAGAWSSFPEYIAPTIYLCKHR